MSNRVLLTTVLMSLAALAAPAIEEPPLRTPPSPPPPPPPPPPDPIKHRYKCRRCKRDFATYSGIERHTKEYHGDIL